MSTSDLPFVPWESLSPAEKITALEIALRQAQQQLAEHDDEPMSHLLAHGQNRNQYTGSEPTNADEPIPYYCAYCGNNTAEHDYDFPHPKEPTTLKRGWEARGGHGAMSERAPLSRERIGELQFEAEEWIAHSGDATDPVDTAIYRLAQDCLSYMDALEQIHGEAKNSAGADTLWNIEMIARAVLPASEEATDATP